jgi:hypothetical protein
MEDQDLLDTINKLAHEEHELWSREGSGDISVEEHQRLEGLQVTLDQCWDLLHQRRARRRAGLDPDSATVRDPATVEGYQG